MSIDNLTNLMRRESNRTEKPTAHPRGGTITSYDPNTHSVKVQMQPEDYESGWIPLASPNIGSGYGVLVGPDIGAQVIVAHLEGDAEAAVVIGRLFSDQDQPPQVQSGEICIQHQSGTKFFIDSTGNITVNSSQNMTVTTTGNTSLTSTGNTTVTGSQVTLTGQVKINT